MKFLVLLIAVSYTLAADLQAIETQSSARSVQTLKTSNSIPISQKPDQYYQQQYQPPQLQYQQLQQTQVQQPYAAVHYGPTALYQQQQQPQTHQQPAMIIIAQPTPVPPQAAISQAAQHLLNYFQTNPHARYQFLQGNYQSHPQQAYVPQQPTAPAYTYQVMTVQPQYQRVASTSHSQSQTSAPFVPSPQISQHVVPIPIPQQIQQQQQHAIPSNSAQQSYTPPQIQLPIIGQFGHSTHIPHVATLAQLSTQKYLPQLSLRATAPAIITGLENFTPEQQAQLKEQLQSGKPLTPLRSSLPPNFGANIQDSSAVGKSTGQVAQSTSPQEFPPEDDDKSSAQQAQASTSSNYNQGYSSQFSKG